MQKLRLNFEELQVESFDTTAAPGRPARGTVQGRAIAPMEESFDRACSIDLSCNTCGSCDYTCGTCDASCYGTCYASCNGTCNASCNGTCNASCGGTCDYSCGGTCDAGCDTWAASCGSCQPYCELSFAYQRQCL